MGNGFLKDVIDNESPVYRSSAPHYTIPSPQFPAEPNRYVLYMHPACPWCQRANIIHKMKGLRQLIQIIWMDDLVPGHGWGFSGENEWGFALDPLYGFKYLRDLYSMNDSSFNGRVIIPVLWDTKTRKMVSNDSGEIVRMLYAAFDDFLAPQYRESSQGSFFPPNLQKDINTFNSWTYDLINNGVYKAGFADDQESYDELVTGVFEGLDRVEEHLKQANHQPYLFGARITDADIRLYPTILRFDMSYHHHYRCNLRMIRHDYPRIHAWLKLLYWTVEAFQSSTFFEHIRSAYSKASGEKIISIGPRPFIMPL